MDEIVIVDALPEGLDPKVTYKGNYVITLEEFLTLKDSVFFNKEDNSIIIKP